MEIDEKPQTEKFLSQDLKELNKYKKHHYDVRT